MKRIFASLLALAMGANGAVMLAAGRWWHGAVPGVTGTGPFNPHFVTDIGAAHLLVGAAFAWLAWRAASELARGAAMLAAAFLALHGCIHLADAAADPHGLTDLVRDLPGVYLPALIALWSPGPPIPGWRPPMLKWVLHRQIRASVERRYGYDASYMHELIDADVATALKFAVVTGLTPRKHAPAEATAAAGVVGTLTEDCGPCTQISVDLALAGGARPEAIRAILAGDVVGMGPDAALGYRFAKAALARDLEAADAARDEVVRRWGKRGLIALAMALTTSRMYPTLKYAMGYGRACSRVTVAGEPVRFERPLPLAA